MEGLRWLGHASIQITSVRDGTTVFVDPWKLSGGVIPAADILCITHSHRDHFSPSDIDRLCSPKTVLCMTADVAEDFSKHNSTNRIEVIRPGVTVTIGSVTIKGVHAYNPDKPFHPKEKEWVGYIITVDGIKYYHAGDTSICPEMEQLRNEHIDVAMVPIGGTYTMDATQAAQCISVIQPKFAVPIHWGDVVGTLQDAEHFKELITSCQAAILPRHSF
ncbi:MBL fold metallo-hydrolase [Pelomyxa schiedti]|nr:MBL fold metallo-hydrolase [Pelomyxa schiedti]